MLPKKGRRNLSLNAPKERSVPARLAGDDRSLERSVGAATLDSRQTTDRGLLKILQKKESNGGAQSLMAAVLDKTTPQQAYNILNSRMTQLRENTGIGWKTERTSKEFSIKKNSLDWIHLKDRLTINNSKHVEESSVKTGVSQQTDQKQQIADFLSAIAKIGTEANYWLGEDSKT